MLERGRVNSRLELHQQNPIQPKLRASEFSQQNCNENEMSEAVTGQNFLFPTSFMLWWLQWMAPSGGTLGSQDCWVCGSLLFVASTWVFPSWQFAQSQQSWSTYPQMFLCHVIKIRAVQVAASHSHLTLAIRAGQQLRKISSKPFFLFSTIH